VIAVDTDGLLAHPGFRVMEDAWRTVRLMNDIAASSKADLLLQTLDPESRKMRRLLADIDEFMRAEAESRLKSGYPPSGNLITVTTREKDESRAERQAQKFRMDAERSLLGTGTSVAGPLKPKRPFRDGTYRRVIAIKAPETVPQAVGELLAGLPEDHIIDRNPDSI
jgi:primosomal protein N'